MFEDGKICLVLELVGRQILSQKITDPGVRLAPCLVLGVEGLEALNAFYSDMEIGIVNDCSVSAMHEISSSVRES